MAYGDYYGFKPYVSVAQRRKNAAREVAKLAKKGRKIAPVELNGKNIASTFWGKSWCANLEAYSDYENRLPRGRTYVRNGSVVDLQIGAGKVTALVSGSALYEIEIGIAPLARKRWRSLIEECAGGIGSLVELLQGKFSGKVMEVLARPRAGLFPTPAEITLDCSCPDWASMCKHVAAALYGVGARLDEQPELFFTLRQVDQTELITRAGAGALARKPTGQKKRLAASSLSNVFGIELDGGDEPVAKAHKQRRGSVKPTAIAARRVRRKS